MSKKEKEMWIRKNEEAAEGLRKAIEENKLAILVKYGMTPEQYYKKVSVK